MDKEDRKMSKEGQPVQDFQEFLGGQAGLSSIEIFEIKQPKNEQTAKEVQPKKEKDSRSPKGTKEGKAAQKSTTSKLKERWLLTRKTFRYMSDAGKKLFPDGVNPNCLDDVPKVEEHFQKISQRARDFVLWPMNQQQSSPYSRRRRHHTRPTMSDSDIQEDEDHGIDEEVLGATAVPRRTIRSRDRLLSASDLQAALPPEVYNQLVRNYGATTLQKVASRLLEEQLTEEDEYEYEDAEIEEVEIEGVHMRCVKQQTDPQLDMCVQTDDDDTIIDDVKVGAETHAETQAAFAASKEEGKKEKGSALKRFWARRESQMSIAKPETPPPPQEKSKKKLASERDREAPPPKGGVAAKLAMLEKNASKDDGIKMPVKEKKEEKKGLKNVFKMGLKCDMDAPSIKKGYTKAGEGDKFKTVNYDKTLRDIKSKYTPGMTDDEEEEEEIVVKGKSKILKRMRGRGIQVGDPLPQFILSGFRVSSPVEIIHATRRRIRRISSKAESTDMSSSECSLSIPSSLPTSPRYSITVTDDQGTRDLVVSEAEAFRLSQMGVSLGFKRSSIDASVDTSEFEKGIREGVTIGSAHHYQRSISALQASGHLSQTMYNMRGRGSSPLVGGGSPAALKGSQGLLQSFLPAVMQRNRSSGSGHTSRLVAKRIWRTRSKSQSRASAGTTSIWTPMVSTQYLILSIYII